MARTAGRKRDHVAHVIEGMLVVGALLFVTLAENAGAADQKDDAGARAAFQAAYAVLMHPRCMHCHPAGDIPLQGDDNRQHAQSVKRGPDGKGKYGMKCGACHQAANLPGADMPPGVSSDWHMPPPNMRMVFEGKSPGALCRQLKDRRLNGRKTISGAIEHLEADPLVLWGWAPGDGRSTPTLSHADFVQKMQDWANKGAACPE